MTRIVCKNTMTFTAPRLPRRSLWATLIWNSNDWDPRAALVQRAYHAALWRWRVALCRRLGHKLVGCGYGGPESGNDDHYCERCGEYWSVTLY